VLQIKGKVKIQKSKLKTAASSTFDF